MLDGTRYEETVVPNDLQDYEDWLAENKSDEE